MKIFEGRNRIIIGCLAIFGLLFVGLIAGLGIGIIIKSQSAGDLLALNVSPTNIITPRKTPTQISHANITYVVNWTPTPTKKSTPTKTLRTTATSKPKIGTVDHPHPVGITAQIIQNGVLEFTFTIIDVKRGEEAYNFIYDANQFNDPAPAGYEFVLIHAQIEYTGADQGTLTLDKYDTTVVTNGRIVSYSDTTMYSPCCLEPDFDFTLLPGGKADGYLALPVAIDDPNPLLGLGVHNDGSGGVFFSLTP